MGRKMKLRNFWRILSLAKQRRKSVTLLLAFYIQLPPEVEQWQRDGRGRCAFLLQHGFCLKRKKGKRWGCGGEVCHVNLNATQELRQKVAVVMQKGLLDLSASQSNPQEFGPVLPPLLPGGITKERRRKRRSCVCITLPVHGSFAKELKEILYISFTSCCGHFSGCCLPFLPWWFGVKM